MVIECSMLRGHPTSEDILVIIRQNQDLLNSLI